jgi:hypothetical protein
MRKIWLIKSKDPKKKKLESKINSKVYNCRPGAYPTVLPSMDELIKLYTAQIINVKEQGRISHLICDYIEDDQGKMYFLKINSYKLTGKLEFDKDWKLSADYKPIAKKKVVQKCNAEIICKLWDNGDQILRDFVAVCK